MARITTSGLSPAAASRLAQGELKRQDARVIPLESGPGAAGLIGLAAGLAMRGKVPFVNTSASTALLRACEQVRLEVSYHRTNVKIAGTFGRSLDQLGCPAPPHDGIADLAIARSLPEMTVIVPTDAVAAYRATLAAAASTGPVFLRLGTEAVPQVYDEEDPFEIGRGNVLREGADVTVVAAGPRILSEALGAAAELATEEIDTRVIDLHTLKPIDRDLLIAAARETRLVVTVEEHSIHGGLGGAVAEVLTETCPTRMRILGIADVFRRGSPNHAEDLRGHGLDARGIATTIREAL